MPALNWRSEGLERRLAWTLLLVCWLVGVANTVVEPVNRDEHMYLAAAALVGEHHVYRDFAFFQTPYSVAAYRLVADLAPGAPVLLRARVLQMAVNAVLLVALFVLLRRTGLGALLAALFVALLFQTALVRDMASLARNYDLAQCAILLGLILLPTPGDRSQAPWRSLCAGILAALAIGFKLSYAPLALLILAWPLLHRPAAPRRATTLTLLGLVIGLLPLLWMLVDAGPDRLRFNLLQYHYLNAELNALQGFDPYASIAGRARFVLEQLLALHWSLLALAGVAVLCDAFDRNRERARSWVVMAWGFVFAGVLMAAVPRPPQRFYLAPLLFGLVLVAGAHAARLGRRATRALALLCVLAGVLGVALRSGELGAFTRTVIDREQWPVTHLHQTGEALAAQVSGPGRVATTHPLYALEGGLEIYPELAAAEFGWRSGGLLDPAERSRYVIAGPQDLDLILDRRRPAAIVVERDAPWDGPLVAWALRAGYREVSAPDPDVAFYLPADSP